MWQIEEHRRIGKKYVSMAPHIRPIVCPAVAGKLILPAGATTGSQVVNSARLTYGKAGMDRRVGHRIAPRTSGLHRLLVVVGFGFASASVYAQQMCGGQSYPFPYTDVSAVGAPFCPGIMEAYVTGVSKGTTPTTFSPNDIVTRVQMTTFLQRSLDQGLARTSRRAAFNQWWTPQTTNAMQTIAVGGNAISCAADGADIWVANFGQVIQLQAGPGTVLGAWTGATGSNVLAVVAGKVFVAGQTTPGSLYVIDPTQSPGPVTLAAGNLGNQPFRIAFDGTQLWTANLGPPGSVSFITPQSPYTVTTVSTGFLIPTGILFDGASIWVADGGAGTLLKLDASGAVIQTVTVGAGASSPVFDGANIWVANAFGNSVSVVQASTGNVIATIDTDANNQLNDPNWASFDGERILVTNQTGNSVTVFKAADLSFISNVTMGSSQPYGACSDGIDFWVPLIGTGTVLRF
jgi:YVTN family beta-propeller protein